MHGKPLSSVQNTPLAAHTPVLEHPEELVEGACMGEAQKVNLVTSPRMKLFALFINALVLAALTVAMYVAAQNPDQFTPMFFKVFVSLLVPTIIVAIVGRRLIARAERR